MNRILEYVHVSRGDLLAGVSVALVVVPQAMAYAEIAGVPAHVGLYAAALPSVAAAFFASSPYLQTGPVAVTALLTFGALVPVAEPRTAAYVGLAALLAIVVGIARTALGIAGVGAVAYLMSQPLILGFTSGAGVLIILSQLPLAVGGEGGPGGVIASAIRTMLDVGAWDPVAVALTTGTVGIIVVAKRIHPLIPGVLIAAVGGIVFSVVAGYQGPVVGAVPEGLPALSLSLPWQALPSLFLPGVVIALVGFAEPATIARTYAAQARERWDPDREFLAQGVANLASGLSGAFPVGGSFSRSSINRMAGAETRWAGGITGLVVLLCLPFASVIAALPRAVLAGIIIASVAGLVRLGSLRRVWSLSRAQAAVTWTTFVLTLALAPRVDHAVVLGIVLAAGVHLWRELPLAFRYWFEDETLHLKPRGVLWFGSAPIVEDHFLDLLSRHEEAERLVVHMEGLGRVDLTGALLLQRLVEDAESAGLDTRLASVPAHAHRILGSVLEWEPTPADSPAGGPDPLEERKGKEIHVDRGGERTPRS